MTDTPAPPAPQPHDAAAADAHMIVVAEAIKQLAALAYTHPKFGTAKYAYSVNELFSAYRASREEVGRLKADLETAVARGDAHMHDAKRFERGNAALREALQKICNGHPDRIAIPAAMVVNWCKSIALDALARSAKS